MEPLPDALKRYVADAPVCRIATVKQDGAPHVIPVCPVFDGDTIVYIDIDPKSATAAALRHEPRIAVLFDEYHDDWSKLRKVLLSCRAEESSAGERDAAWARIREKFPQYAGIDWHPRLTMALRIQSWLQEGFALE